MLFVERGQADESGKTLRLSTAGLGGGIDALRPACRYVS
jgi:hypothetical protein